MAQYLFLIVYWSFFFSFFFNTHKYITFFLLLYFVQVFTTLYMILVIFNILMNKPTSLSYDWMKVNNLKFPALLHHILEEVFFHIPASQHHWRNTLCHLFSLGMQWCCKAKLSNELPCTHPSSLTPLRLQSTFQVHWQLLQQHLARKRQSTSKVVCSTLKHFSE